MTSYVLLRTSSETRTALVPVISHDIGTIIVYPRVRIILIVHGHRIAPVVVTPTVTIHVHIGQDQEIITRTMTPNFTTAPSVLTCGIPKVLDLYGDAGNCPATKPMHLPTPA